NAGTGPGYGRPHIRLELAGIKAFVVARTAPGSSFATLHSWAIGQPAHRVKVQQIIPAAVRDSGECTDNGTAFGATAGAQCQRLQHLAANTIIYYLFPSRAALASGFSQALTSFGFHRTAECTANGEFTDFIAECQSVFTIKSREVTGSIAEYTNTGSRNP